MPRFLSSRQSLDTLIRFYVISSELEIPSHVNAFSIPCSPEELLSRILIHMVQDWEVPRLSLLFMAIEKSLAIATPIQDRLVKALVVGELQHLDSLRDGLSRRSGAEQQHFQSQIDKAVTLRTSLEAEYNMPVTVFSVNTS
jgi:hypothetical protein